MPFDPNIIREEDAGFEGDLKLPDDLALMAEQLGDDGAKAAMMRVAVDCDRLAEHAARQVASEVQ